MPKKKDRWVETSNEREVQQRRYLAEFGQYHYAWLREIGRRWKKRGEYAFDRFSLMDYYQASEDIEVAGYVSLLTNDNVRLHDQITALRGLIGSRPWEMVKNRDFIVLSKPELAGEKIIGTAHRKGDLFNVLDWVWSHWKSSGHGGIEKVVKIQDESYMMDMLSVRLIKDDGIGKGVMPDYGVDLSCPVNKAMLKVLKAFYPKSGRYGLTVTANNADDVLAFMGYDDPTEFIYSYQGYCRMRELMPEAMLRNENLFQRRYHSGWCFDEKKTHFGQYMKSILPEIRFE